MLVLRRRVGETLLLSGGVEIEVIGISRSRVKLGIRAPKSVVVQRKEGLSVAEDNLQASKLMQMATGSPQAPSALVAILNKKFQTNGHSADK